MTGSSLYHYGLTKKIYARKYWDLVEVERPVLLVILISAAFLTTIVLALYYLQASCAVIVILDALAIIAYSRKLSAHWTTKNLTIAFVCTTPVLVGWFFGHRLHPIVPYLIGATFFGYLAREIIKDYTDLKANKGIRVTIPMWLGVENALRIAAGCVTVCILCLMPVFDIIRQDTPACLYPLYTRHRDFLTHHTLAHQIRTSASNAVVHYNRQCLHHGSHVHFTARPSPDQIQKNSQLPPMDRTPEDFFI